MGSITHYIQQITRGFVGSLLMWIEGSFSPRPALYLFFGGERLLPRTVLPQKNDVLRVGNIELMMVWCLVCIERSRVLTKTCLLWLVVSTQLKNISRNWIISPGRGENRKSLKPPPSYCFLCIIAILFYQKVSMLLPAAQRLKCWLSKIRIMTPQINLEP